MLGLPQMVLVHVDVGTENLGGSVHNIARGRIPALIVAGLSPVTLNGELVGSRTEFIHFLQDTPHQDDLVRPYVKWSYELRAAPSAESVFLRAMQIASTEPQGPVYLTGAREFWCALAELKDRNRGPFRATEVAGLTREAAQQIAAAVIASKRPLVIVSYLGRNTRAVDPLVKLSEHVGIGVLESVPQTANFPGERRITSAISSVPTSMRPILFCSWMWTCPGCHCAHTPLTRLVFFISTAIRSRVLSATVLSGREKLSGGHQGSPAGHPCPDPSTPAGS